MTEKVPECKVLLSSGNAATGELVEQARNRGLHLQLLSKPVHPVEMLRKIAETLDLTKMRQIA